MTILDQLSRIEDKIALMMDEEEYSTEEDPGSGPGQQPPEASGQEAGERDPDTGGSSGKQPDPKSGMSSTPEAEKSVSSGMSEPVGSKMTSSVGPDINVTAKEPVSMAGGGSSSGLSSSPAHGGSSGSWEEPAHGGASGSWEEGGPNEAQAAEGPINITAPAGFSAVGATAGVNAALSGAEPEKSVSSGEASHVGGSLSSDPEVHAGGPGVGGGHGAGPVSSSIETSMSHGPSGTMGGGIDPINSMAMMHAGAPASLPGYGKQRGGDSAYKQLRRIFWP